MKFKIGLAVTNFNSHTREGVTKHTVTVVHLTIYFNSHTREGVTLHIDIKRGHTHYMGDYCVSVQKMSIKYLLYIGIYTVFFLRSVREFQSI